jgi:DNA replication protein DnaC
MRLARLPYAKTLNQFDFIFQPSIDERQIRELQTLRFVHDASNVILLGSPRVGKTAQQHNLPQQQELRGMGLDLGQ